LKLKLTLLISSFQEKVNNDEGEVISA